MGWRMVCDIVNLEYTCKLKRSKGSRSAWRRRIWRLTRTEEATLITIMEKSGFQEANDSVKVGLIVAMS
jgi:hypothetical protein